MPSEGLSPWHIRHRIAPNLLCPAVGGIKLRYHAHVESPHHRLAAYRLVDFPRFLRRRCPLPGAGTETVCIRESGAVLCSAACQRRLAGQRGDATLAPKHFLDAAGVELFD